MNRSEMGFIVGVFLCGGSGCGDFSPISLVPGVEDASLVREVVESRASDASRSELDAGEVGQRPDASLERSRSVGAPSICHAHANLPGTLLRDRRGAYWMVEDWPERAIIPPEMFRLARLRAESALPMTAFHELCLRDRGGAWFSRDGLLWTIMRLPWGGVVYVDQRARFWSRAIPEAIEAWHDDASHAPLLEVTRERWEADYREEPLRGLPNGTLIQTEAGLFYALHGRFHRFATQELAREAGYRVEQAIHTTEERRAMLGDTGELFTSELLSLCPLATARARREEDADEDGAIRGIDCDDWDPRRAPHNVERCDGVDNNCDGRVDEGFNAALPCLVRNACRSPGVFVCADDGWHTRCEERAPRPCPDP